MSGLQLAFIISGCCLLLEMFYAAAELSVIACDRIRLRKDASEGHPAAKLLEIVTGTEARRVLDDAEVHLAVLAMQSAFAAGDLVGGIVQGVQQLAEHARRPQVRHGS